MNYAKELSLAVATLFLTFLTMTYFAVTKYLTRSGLREQSLILAYSLRGYNPPWQEKYGMRKYGGVKLLVVLHVQLQTLNRKWSGAIAPQVLPLATHFIQQGSTSERFHNLPK